jgi:plasmid stabilization system protein ParE
MRKRYRVEIAPAAERDIRSTEAYIARDKPGAAAKWVRDLHRKFDSLRQFPLRCEIIPEEIESEVEYRHPIFGNYRIIYTVNAEAGLVIILRVIHAARLLRPDLLETEPRPE